MPPAPPLYAKALYQTLFIASLVFLFVALFVVGATSRFGFLMSALALAASIANGRAFMREKDRERESGGRDGGKS
jgi:hypothetical protein